MPGAALFQLADVLDGEETDGQERASDAHLVEELAGGEKEGHCTPGPRFHGKEVEDVREQVGVQARLHLLLLLLLRAVTTTTTLKFGRMCLFRLRVFGSGGTAEGWPDYQNASITTVSSRMDRISTRSERIVRADKDREAESAIAATTVGRDGILPCVPDFGAFHVRYSCVECAVRCTDGGLCGRCKHVRYCSKACQVAGWKRVHKRTCGKFSQWPTIESLCGATTSQLVDVLTEWAPTHLAAVGVALPRLVAEIDQLSQNDAERLTGTLSKVVRSLSSTALNDNVGSNWILPVTGNYSGN